MYRTALRDKLTAYNRVIEPQPIAGRSGDTLNRIGRTRAGSLREHAHDKVPLSFDGSRQTQTKVVTVISPRAARLYTNDAALADNRTLKRIVCPTLHEKGILLHGGPPSDFRFRLDENQHNEGHMVRVKNKP